MPSTAAQQPPQTATHPLAPLVLELFERTSIVDVTVLALALAGALVHPNKGHKAYRIVAADVLGSLWHQGILAQYGQGNPRLPERGGFWYTLA